MMKLRITNCGVIAALALSVLIGLNLSAYAHYDGGQKSLFYSGFDARLLAMGGAGTSLADGANGMFWNTAALGFAQRHTISINHRRLLESNEINSLSGAFVHERFGTFAVSFSRLGLDGIPKIQDWTATGEEFGFGTSLSQLAYGYKVSQRVAIGAALKLQYESLDGESSYAPGFDLSAMYMHKIWRGGVTFTDLGSPRSNIGDSAQSNPRGFSLGAGISELRLTDDFTLSTAIDLGISEDQRADYHTGLELTLRKAVYLRGGVNTGDPTFGAGFSIGDARIDYALQLKEAIDDLHTFSFSFAFGKSPEQRQSERLSRQRIIGQTFVEHERQSQSEKNYQLAEAFRSRQEYDSALVYYRIAQGYDSSRSDVRTAIVETTSQLEALVQAQQSRVDTVRIESASNPLSLVTELIDRRLYNNALGALTQLELDRSLKAEIEDSIRIQREAWRTTEMSQIQNSLSRGENGTILERISALMREFPRDSEIEDLLSRATENYSVARLMRESRTAIDSGNRSQALSLAEAALAIDPANSAAQRLADSLRQGAQGGGLDDIARDPEDWESMSEALRLARENKHAEALVIIDRLLTKYPENVDLLRNRRQLLLRLQGKE